MDKKGSADVGLMFTAYNLRRLMNIIDKNVFNRFLQELASLILLTLAPLNVIFWSLLVFKRNSFETNLNTQLKIASI